MSGAFTTSRKVRFADCDSAGIAFYPRLMEHVNGVVEDWFTGPLNCPFDKLHFDQQRGIPTVTVTVDFRQPARLGSTIEWRLTVRELKTSSVTLSIVALAEDGGEILKAAPTLVYTDFAGKAPRAMPFPDEMRKQMLAYSEPATQTALQGSAEAVAT